MVYVKDVLEMLKKEATDTQMRKVHGRKKIKKIKMIKNK